MKQLCILVGEPLVFVSLENGRSTFINLFGRVYEKRRAAENEVVFYDWIVDEAGAVQGLELHLPPDHRLLRSKVPLTCVSLIETDCFVRIWFGRNRAGEPQGKEAFGDIFFFGTGDNELAILVDLSSWLTESQASSLLNRLCSITP